MGSLRVAAILLALCCAARAEDPAPQETIQSDISTREISIQSNFTGIEIRIFGSVDSGQAQGKGGRDLGERRQ